MGSKHARPLLQTLSCLYWTLNMLPFDLGGTVPIFQDCSMQAPLKMDDLAQAEVGVCLYDMQKCHRPMENWFLALFHFLRKWSLQ